MVPTVMKKKQEYLGNYIYIKIRTVRLTFGTGLLRFNAGQCMSFSIVRECTKLLEARERTFQVGRYSFHRGTD